MEGEEACAFCKSRINNMSNADDSDEELGISKRKTKDDLMERLRKKMKLSAFKKKSSSTSSRSRSEQNAYNAKKPTRNVQFGWVVFSESDGRYKQVRKNNGGTTRHKEVGKDTTKAEIMEICKTFFYPCGASLYGNVDSFLFDISVDPRGMQLMQENDTVEKTINRTCLKPLKFYLLCRAKEETSPDVNTSIDVDLPDLPEYEGSTLPRKGQQSSSSSVQVGSMSMVQQRQEPYSSPVEFGSVAVMQQSEHPFLSSVQFGSVATAQQSPQLCLSALPLSLAAKAQQRQESSSSFEQLDSITKVQQRQESSLCSVQLGSIATVHQNQQSPFPIMLGSVATIQQNQDSSPSSVQIGSATTVLQSLEPSTPGNVTHLDVVTEVQKSQVSSSSIPRNTVCVDSETGEQKSPVSSQESRSTHLDSIAELEQSPVSFVEGDAVNSVLMTPKEPSNNTEQDVKHALSVLHDIRNYLDINSLNSELGIMTGDEEVNFNTRNGEVNISDERSLDNTLNERDTWKEITVHRGHAFDDMMDIFMKPNYINCRTDKIEVIMKLENGKNELAEDSGGVFRDAVSEFWESFYERCTLGETIKVPAICHRMTPEHWKSVASIIVIGYRQEKYFPIRIALPFFKYCLQGEKTVDGKEVHETFLQYIPEMEKELIDEACKDYASVDEDDLIGMLSCHQVHTLPKAENIDTIISEVAHKELIQAPAYIADCWGPILVNQLLPLLSEPIEVMYEKLTPTTRKVIKMLQFPEPECMNVARQKTKEHLIKYIKGLGGVLLRRFLRFCTGADLLVKDEIQIRFVVYTSEFLRRPVAHTCGCVLELPYDYKEFQDFRNEFNGVLDSNVWVMDIA